MRALAAWILLGPAWLVVGWPPAAAEPQGLAPEAQGSATPGPSATVDATATASALPSATPIPSSTPLPPTPTVTPSVTPISIPTLPGPLPLPSARSVDASAAPLEADLLALLGGGGDPLLDLSADRLAAFWRGSVWLLGLDSDPAVLRGRLPLRRGPESVSQVRLLGDRVILAEGRQATIIDFGRPDAPRLSAELPLPKDLRFIDGDADRIYLLSGGLPGHVAWLDVFELGDDGQPRSLARHSLGIVHVLDMQAGTGLLSLSLRETEDQPGTERWQLFDLSDPTRLQTAGLPQTSSRMMDLAGRQLLTLDDAGLHRFDLSQPDRPAEVGSWDPGSGGVHGAALAGDELRAWRHEKGAAGQTAGIRLWRIARGEDSAYRAIDEAMLEGQTTLEASGSVCQRQGHGLSCRRADWPASRVEWARVHPDAEHPLHEACQSASIAGDSMLLACGDSMLQLEADGDSSLHATGAIGLASGPARFVELGARRYTHGADDRLRLLRREPGGWAEEDAAVQGWWIGTQSDRLVTLGPGRASGGFLRPDRLRIYAADDHRLLGEIDLGFEVDRGLRPVLAGDRLLVHRPGQGWWRIDVSDPAAPQPARPFGDFAPTGLVASGPVGYAILHDAEAQRLDVEVYGLDGSAPRALGRIELGLVGDLSAVTASPRAWIAGPMLLVDRGAGQLARLDIRNPLFPRRLGDLLADTVDVEFLPSGDRMLRIGGGLTLDVLTSEIDATQPIERRWSNWGLGPSLSRLTVLGDRALATEGSTGQVPDRAWLYDLSDPAAPRRGAPLPILDQPAPLRSGPWLYAVGMDGMALLAYELITDGPPQLRGRWCVVDGRCDRLNPNRAIRGLAGRDGFLYLRLRSGELIELDARDPAAIQVIAAHRLADDQGSQLWMAGDVLVTSIHPLVLLDIPRPGLLRPIGRLDGLPEGSSYHALGRAGELILAAGSQILFIDLSQPALPRVRANLALSASVHKLSADGDRLLATTGGDRLWLIDAPSGATPRALGWLPQRGSVRAAGRAGTVYVANNRRGEIEVWSDPRPVDRPVERIWLPFQILQRFGRGGASESGLRLLVEP